jgi:hypothetical protein
MNEIYRKKPLPQFAAMQRKEKKRKTMEDGQTRKEPSAK